MGDTEQLYFFCINFMRPSITQTLTHVAPGQIEFETPGLDYHYRVIECYRVSNLKLFHLISYIF